MTDTTDRRSAFRVSMTAVAEAKKADDNIVSAQECFPDLLVMSLLAESHHIDSELTEVSNRIKDIAAQKSINLLQKKISLLLRLSEVEAFSKAQLTSQSIDLSEGGCSLSTSDNYKVGDRLALAIVRPEDYFSLFAMASVADVSKAPEGYRLHLRFESLSDTQNQKLMQQMFKVQTSQAKQSK